MNRPCPLIAYNDCMRAVTYRSYGPADVLNLEELPDPCPKPEEVLIQVRASSVNPVDWKIRRGDLKLLTRDQFPRVPGIDFAGVVTAASGRTDRFRPGDEVFGVLNALTARIGSSAEYVVARDRQMAHKPAQISFIEAASIPCAGLTAWHALRDLAQLRSGQSVLVHGASGGVGTFAVQIARDMGVAVTGTCSEENLAYVRELGADQAIDYRRQDVRELYVKFDAILDASATLAFSRTKHLLKPHGVFVRTLPDTDLLWNAVATSVWPGRKAKLVLLNGFQSIPKALTDLAGLMCNGRIRSHVSVFPLHELAAAHRTSETGHVRGKIAIDCAPPSAPTGSETAEAQVDIGHA